MPNPSLAATRAARALVDRLCTDPAMWATHGMPGEEKLATLEVAIAELLDRWAPAPSVSAKLLGFRVFIDPMLPPDTVEFCDAEGRTLGRIINLGQEES